MDLVTLSSKGQIVIPSKVRKKFSLKEGDSLVIVEEKDAIRLHLLVNLSELWGVDKLKNTGRRLNKMRKEWDGELEEKAALWHALVPRFSNPFFHSVIYLNIFGTGSHTHKTHQRHLNGIGFMWNDVNQMMSLMNLHNNKKL